ncbi:hypothetical protein GCM10009608_00570 [Pseudonocardia alaniniphila]
MARSRRQARAFAISSRRIAAISVGRDKNGEWPDPVRAAVNDVGIDRARRAIARRLRMAGS